MQQQPYSQPELNGGQMIAVMRAAMATGPRCRGWRGAGRAGIEERIIKQRVHVTVGPSERACSWWKPHVPPNFRLFQPIGNEYYLNFDGMSVSRAAHGTRSEHAQGQARRTQQGAYRSPSATTRGKVVVGETTFLFQFVAPPPVQPKPQLPVSVQAGLANDIDWGTTIIAAFSFLFHFGAVGSIYSDWMDPIVDDEVDVAGWSTR
jgi:hypothetical protein